MKVTVLAGGVGGARMAAGLASVLPDPRTMAVIVNTGDDEIFHGLHVSPDIDTVMYTLAGLVNPETGWGVAGDTDACLQALGRYGEPTWFYLGDRDLATHILRTWWMRQGRTLSEVTAELARRLGVMARILPMSDDPVKTRVTVELAGTEQELPFQAYFVQHRAALPVRRVRFEGIERARPAPGVLAALDGSDIVVIAPSNPVVSIAPILALPGVREGLARRRRRVAVSPLAAGRAFKGPAVEMMRGLGLRPDAVGVAAFYRGLIDRFVIDPADKASAPEIEAMGIRPVVAPIALQTEADRRRVATLVLEAADEA